MKNRHRPAVLRRSERLVIPISALDQPHGEARPARARPVDQIDKVFFRLAQIGLNNDAGVRPITKLRLAAQRFEKLERDVFERKTFHVEIDKRAELFGAAHNGTQLGREVRDGISRVGWINL